jgi:hypothetical protein
MWNQDKLRLSAEREHAVVWKQISRKVYILKGPEGQIYDDGALCCVI